MVLPIFRLEPWVFHIIRQQERACENTELTAWQVCIPALSPHFSFDKKIISQDIEAIFVGSSVQYLVHKKWSVNNVLCLGGY